MAVILGCMTAAILVAEATIMLNDVDLSLFSVLINKIGRHELLVQVYIRTSFSSVHTIYKAIN